VTELRALANRACDPAGLVAFRLLFGLVLFGSTLRFMLRGWVEQLYLVPSFHFKYYGFEWVTVPSPAGLYTLFAVMAGSAMALSLGLWPRAAALVFGLTFTYVELLDKTTYLNHYYFVSCMTLLLAFVPSSGPLRGFQRDAQLTVPAWSYALLRFQVAVVYVFAGFSKLSFDWLARAEPLKTWLGVYAELPLVGELLLAPGVAHAMSWAGAAFDLAIVPLLLWKKSRRAAYGTALLFHGLIWLLFPVGIFSWLMLASATLFFDPSWPRCLLPNAVRMRSTPRGPPPIGALQLGAMALYAVLQLGVPLRFLAYPGDVNWSEEAFRFSWRVMLTEKTGSVEYRVMTATPAAHFVVNPRSELSEFQYRMLSTQPDMIHEYALYLAERYRNAGHRGVQVFAESHAALNGRPARRLIDESVDLAQEPRSLRPKRWILSGG
jgi:hypothetical protein